MGSVIRGVDDFDSGSVVSTAYNTVNSYCWAGLKTFAAHNITEGTTTAGSNLSPGGVYAYASWGGTSNGVHLEDGTHTGVYQKQNGTLSGTWRCMGYGYQNGKHTKATVYMRIS